METNRVVRWLGRTLVAVGVARVIGFSTGLYPLSVLGLQFGASPLPLVFSRVKGVETYGRRFRLEITDAAGNTAVAEANRAFIAALGGPFSRHKLYVDRLAFWDLSRERRRQAFFEYAVCRDGPVARALGLHPPLSRVVLRIWSAVPREGTDLSFEPRCRR